jgi:TonB family protein
LVLTATVLLAAVATPKAATQLAEAPVLIDRVDPIFPAAARAAGVEGDVRFRASIDASGRVEQVHVQSVPEPGLGFEDAVRAAVSRWRFTPGRLRGVPTPSEYEGVLEFTLTLRGQAMLSASSSDTWKAVRALAGMLRIPIEKADDAAQLLTSRATRYSTLRLPASTVDPPAGFAPDRVTLYVYVTPGMEPARVSVGSIMRLWAVARDDGRTLVSYGHDAIARWFLSELARYMGVQMETLSASAERRAAQSRKLMPAGLSDPCTTAPAGLVRMPRPDETHTPVLTRPRPLVHDIKPTYPADQLEARKSARILFRGEITEHGTLINPPMTEPVDAPASFVSAAQLAFGLWRFTPGETQGCPVRVDASFESSFVLRK